MNKIFFDSGISVDGFFAGDNRGPKNPLGDDGPKIHNWIYQQKTFLQVLGQEGGLDGDDNKLMEKTIVRTGAYIMGKRMFEEGEHLWPEDLYKAPVYVLTHEKREPWVQKGTTIYYFINDGIESALKQAKQNANGKDIRIQGGANMIQQFLNAGLVNDFILHISPIMIGSGIRLFDNVDRNKFDMELIAASHSPLAAHLSYRVTNKK
jgi:dihydrofolate reductase